MPRHGSFCGKLLGALLLAMFATHLSAAEPVAAKAGLSRTAPWITAFADEEVKIQFKVTVAAPVKGKLHWGLSSSERLGLLKGEVAYDGGETVEFGFKTPTVNPGVIFSTRLIAHLYRDGEREPVASYEEPLHIFPRDPFHDRKETLKKLQIKLYDPAGKTAKVLTAAEFPYEQIFNVAAISELQEGILLVGEGVSFREERALDLLLPVAHDIPVLCLAPTAGEFELPKPGAKKFSIAMQGTSFIHQLDKQLDDEQWLDKPVATKQSLSLTGRGADIAVEVATGDGWSWFELQFAPKPRDSQTRQAKLVVVALPLIEYWDAGPTPRFLFSKLIDCVTPNSIPSANTGVVP
ncbi:hypothetical protein [Anatilimnocola floriformis]|uniref:hypothetical protein n=1 Tax=Anatilimnocola floriformis TaxID=2948575 RepID=UPI0020C458DC|nr:hypothetical protein [Anatilimnocola floriformis]